MRLASQLLPPHLITSLTQFSTSAILSVSKEMLCNGIICYENFGAGFFHSVTLWEFTQVAVCIGLPGGKEYICQCGKEYICQCRKCKRFRFNPRVGKIPWRREWQPTSVILPRKFHGQRTTVGNSPWGPKELDMTEPENTRCVYQEFIPFHCYCMIPMHHDPSVERH